MTETVNRINHNENDSYVTVSEDNILKLVAEGKSHQQIAQELGLSQAKVRNSLYGTVTRLEGETGYHPPNRIALALATGHLEEADLTPKKITETLKELPIGDEATLTLLTDYYTLAGYLPDIAQRENLSISTTNRHLTAARKKLCLSPKKHSLWFFLHRFLEEKTTTTPPPIIAA
ncbi:MAG: LuxR C-terminal-related transcriptional regulator [Candidatus Shapirobacteria bacterium]